MPDTRLPFVWLLLHVSTFKFQARKYNIVLKDAMDIEAQRSLHLQQSIGLLFCVTSHHAM